jgi:hypothetical protein
MPSSTRRKRKAWGEQKQKKIHPKDGQTRGGLSRREDLPPSPQVEKKKKEKRGKSVFKKKEKRSQRKTTTQKESKKKLSLEFFFFFFVPLQKTKGRKKN